MTTEKPQTYTLVSAQPMANGRGFSLPRRDGEYRLAPLDGSPAEQEAQAYYTADIDDAVRTARAEYQRRIGPVLPIVNMNGTSRADLIGQCLEAVRGLQVAFEAICAAAPHGRDYPGRNDVWREAMRQHDLRRDTVLRLIEVYTALGSAVAQSTRGRA